MIQARSHSASHQEHLVRMKAWLCSLHFTFNEGAMWDDMIYDWMQEHFALHMSSIHTTIFTPGGRMRNLIRVCTCQVNTAIEKCHFGLLHWEEVCRDLTSVQVRSCENAVLMMERHSNTVRFPAAHVLHCKHNYHQWGTHKTTAVEVWNAAGFEGALLDTYPSIVIHRTNNLHRSPSPCYWNSCYWMSNSHNSNCIHKLAHRWYPANKNVFHILLVIVDGSFNFGKAKTVCSASGQQHAVADEKLYFDCKQT